MSGRYAASALERYIRQVILGPIVVQVKLPSCELYFSEARDKLKNVLYQVVNDASHTIICRRYADNGVVMSLDQFNGVMETAHLLKSPANAAHLAKSIKRYQKGQVVPREPRQ